MAHQYNDSFWKMVPIYTRWHNVVNIVNPFSGVMIKKKHWAFSQMRFHMLGKLNVRCYSNVIIFGTQNCACIVFKC